MKHSRIWPVIYIASLMAAVIIFPQPLQSNKPIYSARIDYILTSRYGTSLLLGENQVVEISAPPPPPGYELAYLRVEFPGGMRKGIVPVKVDKSEVVDDKVTALLSFSGLIKLAASEPNLSSEATVTVSYVQTEWIPLREGDITFVISEPPPPFTKDDLVVRFTIENHAPFAICDVKAPEGGSLLGSELAPDSVKVDYKHVELNLKHLALGAYTVTVKWGEGYKLPSAFIVIEPPFREDTVAPGSSKRFGVGQMQGWRGIGAVVIIYSVAPLSGRGAGEVEVSGELADFAYFKDEIITIRAASFLIPNVNLRFYVKAYIVYGSWFEVRNYMKSTVNVMYTTVFIKEAGDWQPNGVSISVRDSDIKDAMAAYIVVQTPSHGRVTGVKTPSGAELGSAQEGLLPWGGEYRDVRVFLNEAYIQVKAFNSVEAGTYLFKVEWRPISFKLIDDEGEAVIGATVSIAGPINATTTSDEGGMATFKLYKPGVYGISVYFKGVQVASLHLGTITRNVIVVKCNVHRVSWLVVNAWESPLSGAEIVVRSGDAMIARAVTSENGVTPVLQIPSGRFVVQTTYKRVAATTVEDVSSSGLRRIKVNVLFELPFFGGVPITMLEAMLASALTSGGVAGVSIFRKRALRTEELALEE